MRTIGELVTANDGVLVGTRLRNQADFYSLFGAVLARRDDGGIEDIEAAATQLEEFIARANDEDARQENEVARDYYEAARSASNDLRQRRSRIEALVAVLS